MAKKHFKGDSNVLHGCFIGFILVVQEVSWVFQEVSWVFQKVHGCVKHTSGRLEGGYKNKFFSFQNIN